MIIDKYTVKLNATYYYLLTTYDKRFLYEVNIILCGTSLSSSKLIFFIKT